MELNKMKVEIWSDIMCPFCYIGKRNFENALEQFSQRDQVQVIWKSSSQSFKATGPIFARQPIKQSNRQQPAGT